MATTPTTHLQKFRLSSPTPSAPDGHKELMILPTLAPPSLPIQAEAGLV
jgi:hypothetical protein